MHGGTESKGWEGPGGASGCTDAYVCGGVHVLCCLPTSHAPPVLDSHPSRCELTGLQTSGRSTTSRTLRSSTRCSAWQRPTSSCRRAPKCLPCPGAWTAAAQSRPAWQRASRVHARVGACGGTLLLLLHGRTWLLCPHARVLVQCNAASIGYIMTSAMRPSPLLLQLVELKDEPGSGLPPGKSYADIYRWVTPQRQCPPHPCCCMLLHADAGAACRGAFSVAAGSTCAATQQLHPCAASQWPGRGGVATWKPAAAALARSQACCVAAAD